MTIEIIEGMHFARKLQSSRQNMQSRPLGPVRRQGEVSTEESPLGIDAVLRL